MNERVINRYCTTKVIILNITGKSLAMKIIKNELQKYVSMKLLNLQNFKVRKFCELPWNGPETLLLFNRLHKEFII